MIRLKLFKRETPSLLQGPIWKPMLLFVLPVAASSILQQLFTSADMAVVGRFEGKQALAANAVGLWDGYDIIGKIHCVEERLEPDAANNAAYEQLFAVYEKWTDALAPLSEELAAVKTGL